MINSSELSRITTKFSGPDRPGIDEKHENRRGGRFRSRAALIVGRPQRGDPHGNAPTTSASSEPDSDAFERAMPS